MQPDDTAHCGNTNLHSSHIWRASNHKMVHCPGISQSGEHTATAFVGRPAPLERAERALSELNEAYMDLRRQQAGIASGDAEAAYDRLVAVLNDVPQVVHGIAFDIWGDDQDGAAQVVDLDKQLSVWLRDRSKGL
jgi:hypothetical protein